MSETKKVSGKIENINVKEGAKNGRAWVKTTFRIDGVLYSRFGKTVDREGDEVTLEYVTSAYGNDIVSIVNHTQSKTEKQRQHATDTNATAQAITDFSALGVRRDAINFALIFHVNDKDVTTKQVIDTARDFESYLTAREKSNIEALEKSSFNVMKNLVISRVRASKDKVACADVDKYFICDAETRERVYAAAEKTLEVARQNGFWVDLVGKSRTEMDEYEEDEENATTDA